MMHGSSLGESNFYTNGVPATCSKCGAVFMKQGREFKCLKCKRRIPKTYKEKKGENKLNPYLTPREAQIVSLMMNEGLSNGEISKRLLIVEGTIKVYMSNIHAKLGVRSERELMSLVHREGLQKWEKSSV